MGKLKRPTINISKTLNDLMRERRVTNKELSEALGVSQPLISNLRNGKNRNPSGYVYLKLADYFGVSLDYLMGRVGTETDQPDTLNPGHPLDTLGRDHTLDALSPDHPIETINTDNPLDLIHALIAQAKAKSVRVSMTITPDYTEIEAEPWQRYEPKCPYAAT